MAVKIKLKFLNKVLIIVKQGHEYKHLKHTAFHYLQLSYKMLPPLIVNHEHQKHADKMIIMLMFCLHNLYFLKRHSSKVFT